MVILLPAGLTESLTTDASIMFPPLVRVLYNYDRSIKHNRDYMKICRLCKQSLPFSFFHKCNRSKDKLKNSCKDCRNRESREYIKNNRTKYNAYQLKWQKANLEKRHEYRENAKHKYGSANISALRWQKNNKEMINTKRKQKYQTDPKYKMICDIRSLVSHIFSNSGYTKDQKTEKIIGIGYEELVEHLIKTCIDRYGHFDPTEKYHIDHIIPISSGVTEEEIIKLNHFSNLQLLKKLDNLRKSNKIIDSLQPNQQLESEDS